MAVYREMRARPSYLSAFVPQTDDFFARQNHCRNAILVDVLPPRNLGHFPQETIANRLAARFGGLPSDFHVAKYSSRDFVIFLPEWVPAAQLVRREILSLDNLRLQCYSWNPYSGLRRASLTYNVWIRLVCLPYECWSSRTVVALVTGFGRFIRADDFSNRMVDLTGYRCLVAVNFLSDIPENLEITVGDYSLSVLIQLERWGRRDYVDPRIPPNERTDQHDPGLRDHESPHRSAGSVRGRRSSAGGSSSSDAAASWNSSEIRDRRREVIIPDSSLCRNIALSSEESNRRGDDEKGPAIVGKRGTTDGNLNFAEADGALIEGVDGERGRSLIATGGPSSKALGKGKDLLQASLSTCQSLEPSGLVIKDQSIYYCAWKKRPPSTQKIYTSSSSSGPGMDICFPEQWVLTGPKAVRPGLGRHDTSFVEGMGPSVPLGPEACCMFRWGPLLIFFAEAHPQFGPPVIPVSPDLLGTFSLSGQTGRGPSWKSGEEFSSLSAAVTCIVSASRVWDVGRFSTHTSAGVALRVPEVESVPGEKGASSGGGLIRFPLCRSTHRRPGQLLEIMQ
uniref:Uncharacterized protein n=1 Tax=Ananas comosus var. bracteatus TaxID=296719 RepID=A0A6V7QDR4_ANACO|nr:unnamed protein product [Ananas comosus var. bracteatus]